MKVKTIIGYIVACALCWAETPQALIKKGNVAYEQKDYATALALYEEASVEAPKSAELSFNKGAIYYQTEEYAKAIEAYKEAAVESANPALSASAKYNIGNCAFRLAKRQSDSDLGKAIEHCKESVNSYLESLDLNPKDSKASENIEIVRLYAKTLIDAQKQQEQQQKDQKKNENNLLEKLKKVTEKQAAALKAPITDSDQKELRDETQAIQEEIRQTKAQLQQQMTTPQDPNQPTPAQQTEQMAAFGEKLEKCEGHVTDAIQDQQQAIDKLSASPPEDAKEAQTQAVVDLVEAMKSLSDEDNKDQNCNNQKKEGDKGDSQDKQKQEQSEEENAGEEGQPNDENEPSDQSEQDASEDQGSQGDSPSEEEQKAQEARAESADDILDEEKNNQKQMRPHQQRGRMQRVDKDW